MSIRFLRQALLGSIALALAACATSGQKPASPDADENAAAADDKADQAILAVGRPAMWLLSDEDSEIYLFASFHILPPDVDWTSDAYNAAMQAAATTITEADTTSPEAIEAIRGAVAQYGLNPEGVTLSETLGEKRAGELAALAQELGAPMAALEPMRPWLALLSLTQLVFQQSGFDPTRGVEAAVLARAEEEGDMIAYLETAESQIKALASLDGEDMFANYDTTIDQFGEFEAVTNRLLTAWRTGDMEGIEKDILSPLRDASPNAYAALFTTRNTAWTTQIETFLAGDGNYFITVGAGHLAGEGSVIDMLEDKGLQIERVQ